MTDRVIEELDEGTCLTLIAGGGIGRIAYTSRFGPAVLPVNYTLHGGAILFRATEHGTVDEDLRTGIDGADYKVAFEVDDIDLSGQRGWIVLIQGPAHHVSTAEREAAMDLEPLALGGRELFVRITPVQITGRSIRLA
jgi:nitroimidazol reductase NimA-like FMN-containing flavoprotein (pyridoxamine 5'-phosphate oxidase superfamily)